MARRQLFRRPQERTFRVELTVHQLDSVPALHKLFFIYWRARRSQPNDGRTPAQPVQHGNIVRWDNTINFDVVIPSETNDPTILRPSILQVQLRSERQGRWISTSFTPEGNVAMDLSEVAAVGILSRNHLVQDSMLNMTLKLTIRVTHHAGDRIFRIRTAPSSNRPPLPKDPSSSSPNLFDDNIESDGIEEPSSSQAEAASSDLSKEIDSTLRDESGRAPRKVMCTSHSAPNIAASRAPDRVLPPAGIAKGAIAASQFPALYRFRKVEEHSSNTTTAMDEVGERDTDTVGDSSSTSLSINELPLFAGVQSVSGISSSSMPSSSGTTMTGISTGSNAGSNGRKDNSTAHPTSEVLEGSFPIPEVVQKDVYEAMFQQKLRDTWPEAVVKSRVNAEAVVNMVYRQVCAADGIATVSTPATELFARGDVGNMNTMTKE